MNIRITGRFGNLVQRGRTTVAVMRCRSSVTPLDRIPDELPPAPDMPVTYTVLIAPRHRRAIDDRRAQYFVEGMCLYDRELKGLTVIATSIKPSSVRRAGK